jgi:threonine synthase
VSYVIGLRCRECGKFAPANTTAHVCDDCFGPYEVAYDYDGLARKVTRVSIARGPRNVWRYRDLLPVNEPATGFNSGWTPLRRSNRLARELGCDELYIKDDSANYPTFSYKERVVSVAISKAVELGFDTVGCASTGNLANSVAAHAAAAGLRCFVFIPHDLEKGKVVGSQVFGPQVVRIKGNYDDVNRLCTQVADRYGWAIVNVNLRPFYTEGAKTFGFEIAEQLGWRLPRHTILPVAGGTILPKVAKAYEEFIQLGLVNDNAPRYYAAQAAGCNPIVTAIQGGTDVITPQKPRTIAKSIAIGNPADGHYVAKTVTQSGGWGESATDGEIIDAIKLLARTEGIWTEPAGGATLAAAIKLIKSGRIPRDESICIGITGSGLKTLETLDGALPECEPIAASIDEFDRRLNGGASVAEALLAGAI